LDVAFALVQNQIDDTLEPLCEVDALFLRSCGQLLQDIGTALGNEDDNFWHLLHQLYVVVKEKSNKLSIVLLPKISEELAQKRDFEISVPGRYKIANKLKLIEPMMEVIGTQQHPRIVFMMATEGKRYKYLLKGIDDRRDDERLMQFFSLANSIFRQNAQSSSLDATIIRYAVIPLSPNSGLISWVTGADTMHRMVCDFRDSDELYERDVIAGFVTSDFGLLNKLQKFEIFKVVSEQCPAHELCRLMWIRAPSAAVWMGRSSRFTITTALMSMVGFLIGLGDRHPSNIMIQHETGNVVHIDYGESFESTLHRRDFPEKVQFRLTRMIQNAIEGGLIDGFFRKTCEIMLSVLRTARWSLEALLEIFVNEEKQGKSSEVSKAVKRISGKLRGESEGEYMTVPQQVRMLIDEAKDPMNYVQHYPGWCPFW
jgi:phosphatidylinositol kinase/protein kinase (PI-3  family)